MRPTNPLAGNENPPNPIISPYPDWEKLQKDLKPGAAKRIIYATVIISLTLTALFYFMCKYL